MTNIIRPTNIKIKCLNASKLSYRNVQQCLKRMSFRNGGIRETFGHNSFDKITCLFALEKGLQSSNDCADYSLGWLVFLTAQGWSSDTNGPMIFVLRSQRKKGIGGMLLKKYREITKGRQHSRYKFQGVGWDEASENFYKSNGFPYKD